MPKPNHGLFEGHRDADPGMPLEMVRIPFSPAMVLLGILGCAALRGSIELVGLALGEDRLFDRFLSAVFDRTLPIPDVLFHAPMALGTSLDPGLFALLALITVVVWTVFAVAICRIAAVRIATGDPIGARRALGDAWSVKWNALLYAVGVAAVLALLYFGNGLAGLLVAVPIAGPLLFTLALPFATAIAVAFTLIALAHLLTLGLTTASLATERRGPLDAAGRSILYAYSEPLYFLLGLGLLLVAAKLVLFAGEHVLTPMLAGSLGSILETDTLRALEDAALGHPYPASDPPRALAAGAYRALRIGLGVAVPALAGVIVLSGTTSIYFRLRERIDGVALDDLDAGLRPSGVLTGVPAERGRDEPASDVPDSDPRDAS